MAGAMEKFSLQTGGSGRAAGFVVEQRKWPNDVSEDEHLFCTCCLHLEATECADKVRGRVLVPPSH